MSSETEAQSPAPTDVGARLRAAREARQISLSKIAATTRISTAALEALEQNDIASLPGGIFTRAFVRAYASEVGLDPEETMRDFVAQVPVEGSADGKKHYKPSPEHDLFQSQQRMAGTVLKLALVAVPVAGLLLFLGIRDAVSPEDAPEEPAVVEMTTAAAPLAVAPRVAPPPLVESPEPAAVAPQGPLAIVLRPREDCWVSLTIDGELVFSRVMRTGERESYDADDEIILNVGDAGAFEFAINQQAGRSLGGSGEVVTARITHQNYRSYVAP
jgi:cytoskeletal protein RodZ